MRTRWMMTGLMVAAVWFAAASAYAQQSDADWLAQCKEQHDGQFRHCEVRPITLAATGSLHVDAQPNGGVQIAGWDQAGVSGSARIQVQTDNEAEAREIASRITVDTTGATVKADGPRNRDGRSWSASFVLSAPRQTDVTVEAVNGPISLSGLTGRIRADTTNGPMSLTDLGGDVRARTTNGPLKILLIGTAWDGEGLDAETHNGPVNITVPEGYSAQLEASTVNGPLRSDIPITLQGDISHRRVRSINTAIGGGGARIHAVTTNGPLVIEQR
jgi:hypothetical protein